MMHFVFSYDLSATGDRRKELEERITTILKPYRWAKRLSTFYIIEVSDTSAWQYILKQFSDMSNEINEKFHFVMSPPQSGGRYNGVLPNGQWDFVNTISTGVQ